MGCNHDCESCSGSCGEPESLLKKPHEKSTIRTGKRPKKFKILRAYSILSYGRRSIALQFCSQSRHMP